MEDDLYEALTKARRFGKAETLFRCVPTGKPFRFPKSDEIFIKLNERGKYINKEGSIFYSSMNAGVIEV